MSVSPSRSAAFDILMRVEQGAFADELLHSARLDGLSLADRALCTEIVMGVLRWRSQLDELVARWSRMPAEKLDPEITVALRIGAYQLTHLERVPAHAAVHETVELVKNTRRRFAAPMVNAVLRRISESGRAQLGQSEVSGEQSVEVIAHATAHPLWLLKRWVAEYGLDAARRIAEHDQQTPVVTLWLDDAAAESELRKEGIELAPGSLVTRARRVLSGDVTKTRVFFAGRVHLQDEASQLAALLVGRGTRLLDCCAAPGGKTALMSARNPHSRVVAADLHPARARLMRRLLGSENVRVVAADARALPLRPDFDRILADVPCSGTGTLARNPEIKWRLKPEDLADLHGRQVAILRSALGYLVPGGRLVYSTCSLEREENEDVVRQAVAGDFHLLDCRAEFEQLKREGELVWEDVGSLFRGKFLRTVPGIHPGDGFFAAIIQAAAI